MRTADVPPIAIDPALIRRLHARAGAERWEVEEQAFAAVLQRSVDRRFSGGTPGRREVEHYLEGLHHEDLALACACAAGREPAWDHFVAEFRPVLFRAAAALAGPDDGRELADSIHADLYGLSDRSDQRRPLIAYYHGRSSLAGWLRAVLAQRVADLARDRRRTEPLPDEPDAQPAAAASPPDPDRPRLLSLLRTALLAAIAALHPDDRLRLSMYYAQELTLAEIGRLVGEHEATVSRKLARSRRVVRAATERHLAAVDGLSPAEVSRCFELALDAWDLDVSQVLGSATG